MKSAENAAVVVRFPSERVGHPARAGATLVQRAASKVRRHVGAFMNRAGIPAVLQPVEIDDKLTGQHLAVSVDELFVRVSVSGRDYYFDRMTGRFDGTGSATG